MNLRALIQQYRNMPNKNYCKIANIDCCDLLLIKNKYGFNIFYPICTNNSTCSNQTKDILMCKRTPNRISDK